MKRHEVIEKVREMVNEEVIVSNIGDASKELFAAGDRDENFYMLGSMGLVSSVGLGISLANKKKVIALDGDGSIFMNLGSLVTIALEAPANFNLIILDNGVYGSTGYQETAISKKCSLYSLALAAGNDEVYAVSTIDEFGRVLRETLLSSKPSIIIAKVSKEHKRFPIVRLKAETIINRFVRSISNYKRD